MVQLQGTFQVIIRGLCIGGQVHGQSSIWSHFCYFSFKFSSPLIGPCLFPISIFPLVFTHCLLLFFFYKGTSGRFSSSLSLPLGSFSCTSFSEILFDHFPHPVLDFLAGSLPASLSYCRPPCQCSLMLDKALCATLKDSPNFSATTHIPPMFLMILSPTAITTTIWW